MIKTKNEYYFMRYTHGARLGIPGTQTGVNWHKRDTHDIEGKPKKGSKLGHQIIFTVKYTET